MKHIAVYVAYSGDPRSRGYAQVVVSSWFPGAGRYQTVCCKIPNYKTTGIQATKLQEYRTARTTWLHVAKTMPHSLMAHKGPADIVGPLTPISLGWGYHTN